MNTNTRSTPDRRGSCPSAGLEDAETASNRRMESQHGLPGSVSLLISTNSDGDAPTESVIAATRGDDGRLQVDATRRSRRLFPRIEFHRELPQWIVSSDEAAYGPMTRTIYLATGGRSRLKIAWNAFHELGHHVIEVVSGTPSWHHAYDDAYDWICEKAGRFFDFLFRRK